jgi:hypothetical protein
MKSNFYLRIRKRAVRKYQQLVKYAVSMALRWHSLKSKAAHSNESLSTIMYRIFVDALGLKGRYGAWILSQTDSNNPAILSKTK